MDGFRFDLATDPRPRARRRATCSRAFFDAVHQDPVLSRVKLIAEPWDLGRGRLPASATSRRAGPSGTAATATPSGASGGATPGRWPSSPPGSPGRATSTSRGRPPALGERQLRHRATTASRSPTSSATSASATRRTARTTATAPTTNLSWNCGDGGPDRRPPSSRPPRAAAAELARDAAPLPGRAHAPRRRRARPHPGAATTTPTARTGR